MVLGVLVAQAVQVLLEATEVAVVECLQWTRRIIVSQYLVQGTWVVANPADHDFLEDPLQDLVACPQCTMHLSIPPLQDQL